MKFKIVWPERRIVDGDEMLMKAKDSIINNYGASFPDIDDEDYHEKMSYVASKAVDTWRTEYGVWNAETAAQYLHDIGEITLSK